MILLSKLFHIIRDFLIAHILAKVIIIDFGAHGDQVDDAAEGILRADRQLNRNSIGIQAVLHHINDTEEVSACNVHLIDISHTRNAIGLSLLPNGFRLGFHTALCAEDADSAVQNAQGTFNFYCEVNVAGSVNNVNAVSLVLIVTIMRIMPDAGRGSRGNGDAAFLFLSHPVHRGSAFMGFTHLVHFASVEKDAFRGRCFTGIDVSHDTDIAYSIKRVASGHTELSSFLDRSCYQR